MYKIQILNHQGYQALLIYTNILLNTHIYFYIHIIEQCDEWQIVSSLYDQV